jgi:dienelactone hydrolase
MREIWSGLLAAAALFATGGAQVWASPPSLETPPELIELPAPVGLGRLVLPAHFGSPDAALPVVVVLPDALGEDGRAEPYVEALLSRGIAVLALGLDLPAEGGGGSAAAARLAVDWASRDARLDAARIGLLGLGAGARAALGGGPGRPVVALYPGCRGLELAGAGSALILYGTEAGDASACAGLVAPSEVELRPIPGAGHGWDVVGTLWLAGVMLPDPAGNGRVRALPNPRATLDAAEMTADHFDAAFGASRSAGR